MTDVPIQPRAAATAPVGTDPGHDLAAWADRGDRAALERALAAATGPAYAQAYRLLGRAADAEDAAQEALVQMVRAARNFDRSKPFRPWLAGFVHHACCRLLRSDRRRRRRENEVAVDPVLPAAPDEPAIDADVVRAAVQTLPDTLRAAVELHYFAGLSQSDTANALRIGVSACTMRLARARDRLRDELRRRGVTATPADALGVLLVPSPALQAPNLAAHISAQAAAHALPATTIPLTPLQSGALLMSQHPVACSVTLAALALATATPFALMASDAAPMAPPAMAPASATAAAPAYAWSPQAQTMLPYLDPAAGFRLAIDLHGMRPDLLKTNPFSLLTEPAMAPVLDAWRHQLAIISPGGGTDLALSACADGTGVVVACNYRLDETVPAQRILWMMDAGDETIRQWHHLTDPVHFEPPRMVGPFTGQIGYQLNNEVIFGGIDQAHDRIGLGSPAWLLAQSAAPAPPAPPAPIWYRFDAGKLFARYAELAGPTGDPFNLESLMPHWRTMRPVVEGKAWVATQGPGSRLESSVVFSGIAPLSPLELLLEPFGKLRNSLTSYCSAPMRRPTLGIPPSPDAIATFALGIDVPLPPLHRAVDPVTALIEEAWSGDAALDIRPGAPLPKAALACGLRPGVDGGQVLNTLAGMLGGTVTAGITPTATAMVLGGTLTLVAYPDRIIATFNADPGEWPGMATATAPAAVTGQAATAECSAMIDFPAIVRAWGPLAGLVLSPEQAKSVPPLPLLIAHLPVWRGAWNATGDGCTVTEDGLPLFNLMIAGATLATTLNVDPVTEAAGRPAAQPQSGTTPAPTKPDNF